MPFETKKRQKREKSSALFCKKRQIYKLSAFPGTFEGRAILKHIFEIKFLVYFEIFSLLSAIWDEKMTKKGEKSAVLPSSWKAEIALLLGKAKMGLKGLKQATAVRFWCSLYPTQHFWVRPACLDGFQGAGRSLSGEKWHREVFHSCPVITP